MFLEDEDWNDDRADVPIIPVAKANEPTSPNVKSKVGKKSLLRTLQTLGPVPEWKAEKEERESDSEDDTTTMEHTKKRRRKKKRNRKRKHGDTEVKEEEQKEEAKEAAPPAKKKSKSTDKNVSSATSVKLKDQACSKPVDTNKSKDQACSKPADMDRLSRQQWKNRMKNKRNCKNKFKPKVESETEKTKVVIVASRDDHSAQPVKKNKNTSKFKANVETEATDKTKDVIAAGRDDHTAQLSKKNKNKFKANVKSEESQKTDANGNININERQVKKKGKKEEQKASKEATQQTIKTDTELPKKANFDQKKKAQMKKDKLLWLLQKNKAELAEAMKEAGDGEKEESAGITEEPSTPSDLSASLRSRMEQRLDSARFRYINEVLYSSTSGAALRMFTQDQEAFWVYHRGYSAQVQKWPHNPVDNIIRFIKQKPASLVVADFGCGDCKIAKSVKNRVHSFDLVSTCELATACDMAKVPLKDSSVDIAVFCLSLMGTNLADFLIEANRVLKNGGFLKIAEVSSRFDNVRSFITALATLGFKLMSKNTENSHFYTFDFVKTGPAPEKVKKFRLALKPCVYKKR